MANKIKIGILANEFLINIGANDFLKNLIRGLALNKNYKLYFICPVASEILETKLNESLKYKLKKIPYLKYLLRKLAGLTKPLTNAFINTPISSYEFYQEASEDMELVQCEKSDSKLKELMDQYGIDVFFPSIHILDKTIPYISYWPDCQPKYYPEFFDENSQKARDSRIAGLLASGNPMIINSLDAKRDMVKFYGANPEQIYNLPFAPIVDFKNLMPRPELLRKYPLPQEYFLICNQFWLHKSIETVIVAAGILKRRGHSVNFVFTGKMQEPRKPEYIDMLRNLVIEQNVVDVVTFLDYIPKSDQLEIMKHAKAVIQPTLFEGGPGGGAVYDAVGLGVRSIVSNIPINYELPVDDGLIIHFEKRDSEDLVEKILQVLSTPSQKFSIEELSSRSKEYTALLSHRLSETIDSYVANKKS